MKMYKIEEIKNKILEGDSLYHLKQIPSESINCIKREVQTINLKNNFIVTKYAHKSNL